VPSLTLAGYYFGKAIPADLVDVFFIGLVVAMVVLSSGPAIWHLLRQRRARTAA
jgi:hypothetical protein